MEGLLRRVRDDVLEVGDSEGEGVSLRLHAVRRAEVGADAVSQRRRLADVDDASFLVAEDVDAGLVRQGVDAFD